MSIGLNAEFQLSCSPFGSLGSSGTVSSITNLDIFAAEGKWIHVACAYDSTEKRIELTASVDGQEYPTFLFVQDDSRAIRRGDVFNAVLFNNLAGTAISAHVAFREFRVWTEYRNSDMIMAYRHTSLNVEKNVEENGLRSYYRFASGLKDYRDSAQEYWYGPLEYMNDLFTLESVPGLTVCSSANFYQEGYCYTNPFLSTSIFYTMENVYNEDEDED